MFDYTQHCGHKATFFTEDKLNYVVDHMEKLDSINIPEGNCKGIDINHTAEYNWFIENFLDPLREYTQRPDLGLIFGFLGDVTQSFRIHQDVKTIPKNEHNPKGTQFASFLIPVSVDYDPNKCYLNSTMIFDLEVLSEPTGPRDWHWLVEGTNPLVKKEKYGWINYKHYNLIRNIQWERGDLIWWNSLYWHCGLDNNAIGINTKQMIVIHTYV